MKKELLVAFFFILTGCVCAQDNFDTVQIKTHKLAESIYMLEGSGGNIAVLTGSDGIIMVDDQFAPLSEKIKAAVKTLDAGQIKFLINTHIHGDHSGGNENFKRLGASIVAHDNVRSRMQSEQTNKVINMTTPPRDKDALPVITFSEKISFHYDGQDIDVLHFANGHTDGDIVIRFKNANVFHTGDLFVRYGYPFMDVSSGGHINGFIENLDKMLQLMDDNSIVIPGHGAVAAKKDVKIFRDRLKDIRDQVAAALKKGKKPADIPALGITDKYDTEWGKGFLKGKDFALMIAENLSGGESTQVLKH